MVRVRRTFEIDAPRDQVWEFISNPDNRAKFLSSVKGYRVLSEDEVEWDIGLPVIGATIKFRTRDVEKIEGEKVVFEGSHSVVSLRGVHELHDTENGVKVDVLFEVKSGVPGVERAFKRRFDKEIQEFRRVLVSEVSKTQ